jgi:bifunctional DNase/RNase
MDIHHDLPSAYPMVTLQEAEAPLRTLSFPVGLPEGTAMAHALRRIATPRPLTHELFADVLARYRVDVVAVRLVGRAGGNYLAEIDFIGAGGREVVPCRPTDALTLALRMPVPAPILCDERLLEDEGEIEPR